MAEPDSLAAEKQRQNGNQDGRPDKTSRQRHRKRFPGIFVCLPEGDHQDIESGKEESAEIRQALALHEIDQFDISRIENRIEAAGEENDQEIAYDSYNEKDFYRKVQKRFAPLFLSRSHKVAEDWLQA